MSQVDIVEEGVAADIAARLERLPVTSYQRFLLLVIGTAWFFDSVDLGTLTFTLSSIRSEYNLSTAQSGFLSSMSFIGMLLGASTAGLAADRFGRKSLFQVSMIFWGIGSILCGLSVDLFQLHWARVLVGFGMGMEFPVAQAIASEIAPARRRARTIALLEGCWPLGFVTAGGLAYFLLPSLGWRTIFLLEGIPAIFLFVVRRYIPESPRWLADHGLNAKAEEVMSVIESEVRRRLKGQPLPDKQTARKVTLRHKPPFWRRTFMLWIVWFSAMLGYYGLTTWIATLFQQRGFSLAASTQYITLMSSAGIAGSLLAAWVIEHTDRRLLCGSLLIGSSVFCFLYGQASSLGMLLAYGALMQFCLFAMWSVLYAYTPELYPTRARATGAGFASAIGRVGSLLGPSIVGALILPHGGQMGVFVLGAGAFALAALALFVFGENTTGMTVEDISGPSLKR